MNGTRDPNKTFDTLLTNDSSFLQINNKKFLPACIAHKTKHFSHTFSESGISPYVT